MKQDILAEIIANKRKEVEERKASISKEELIKELFRNIAIPELVFAPCSLTANSSVETMQIS